MTSLTLQSRVSSRLIDWYEKFEQLVVVALSFIIAIVIFLVGSIAAGIS